MAQARGCTVGGPVQSGPLDERFLMKLSEQLGGQLLQLGVYLGIDSSEVEKLRNDSSSPVETAFFVLRTWRDSSGKRGDSGAMFDELCQALRDLKREDLLDNVRLEQIRQLSERLQKSKETTRSNQRNFNEQMRLVKEELRGSKAELESCKQKYDEQITHANEELRASKEEHKLHKQKYNEDVRRLNEQVKALMNELQETKVRKKRIETLQEAARPVDDEEFRADNLRAHEVMRLLHEYKEAQLWHLVSHYIVSKYQDGSLDISHTITSANLPDLEYLLCSGEATDITKLCVGGDCCNYQLEEDLLPINVFGDINEVHGLCRGLAAMPKLLELELRFSQLTDKGFTVICDTIRTKCPQLVALDCGYNTNLTTAIEGPVIDTMTTVPALEMHVWYCSLTSDCCARLKKMFGKRIYVECPYSL